MQLEAALIELETAAAEGRYNTICIRSLAGVAALLGQLEVSERATILLQTAPDEAFPAGAIGNAEYTADGVERLRHLDSPERLQQMYRVYVESEVVGRIESHARSDKHLALCVEGRAEEARNTAGAGLPLEEVGVALAALGDLKGAMQVARDPRLEAFRQRGVLFVAALEYFRGGRAQEGEKFLAESDALNAWSRMQLALAIGGREPWGGYPFPDW